MNEHIDFETYLTVSKNKFAIYLFDKKKSEKLNENDLKFENNSKRIDLKILDKFLEDNIFKIGKQIGKFVKNIYLVIDDNRIFHLNKGIRKKLIQLSNENDFEAIFPDINLCGDNAAMIGLVGIEKYKLKKFDNMDLVASPRLALDKNASFLKGSGIKI